MAANQFERHGRGRSKLKELFANPDRISAIHYSCESFYDLPDGRSPRITSIAIRKLSDGQTKSFSIHQIAELRHLPLTIESLRDNYDTLECEMLDDLSKFLHERTPQYFLHWNMRDQNYGFQAIEHRHRVIGGQPFVVPDDRKIDLSRLFVDLYGIAYIDHPRLEKLLSHNNITSKDFMTGAQEAQAFEQGRYVDLHRSTLRKVDCFCNLAQRAWDKSLRTKASWKEMHGLSARTFIYLAKKHVIWTLIVSISALLGAAGGAYKSYQAVASYMGWLS